MKLQLVHVAAATLLALEVVAWITPIPMHAHMLLAATLTVYVGSYLALDQSASETLESNDAVKFPFVAGAGLAALFVAFKYLDALWVNRLLLLYFVALGIPSVATLVGPLVALALPSRRVVVAVSLPLLGPVRWTAADVASLVAGAAVAGAYAATKHWLLNNALGVAFTVEAIRQISLGTYRNGALLLVGLFFYDIFMVFGTPMMVTVALKLDGPIKLLFPRGTTDDATCKPQFSLLGLGDLVIPGLMVALLLRLDATNAHAKAPQEQQQRRHARGSVASPQARFAADPSAFDAPYFNAGILAYIGGLAATVLVMVYFEAAQPALLYLVPAVLLASLATGAVRGEVGRLLGYSDDEYTGQKASGRRYSVACMPDVPGGSGGPVDDALPEERDEGGDAEEPAATLETEGKVSEGGADGGARRRSRRLQQQAI